MIFYVLNQVMSKQGKHKIQKFLKLLDIIQTKIIIILQINNKKDRRKQLSSQAHNQRDQMLDLRRLQHILSKLKKLVKSQNHIEILIKRVAR